MRSPNLIKIEGSSYQERAKVNKKPSRKILLGKPEARMKLLSGGWNLITNSVDAGHYLPKEGMQRGLLPEAKLSSEAVVRKPGWKSEKRTTRFTPGTKDSRAFSLTILNMPLRTVQ